jgi:RND family efflux transporter MFP subunit
MSGPPVPRFLHVIPLALLITTVSSCNKPPPAPPPEPPSVTISYPVVHRVMEWEEYSGYLTSPDTANVVARVSGLIVEATFKEGSLVHQGDILYVIDDRPYKADVSSKQADIEKAQAQLDLALATLHRLDKVRQSKAISETDYDTAKANVEQAQASLAAAKAALDTAQLNLEWTRVTAPINGRVSRQMVQAGNMVSGGNGQSQSTPLTTIVQVDPLYCYVNIPERVAMRFQELAAGNKPQGVGNVRVPCYIQMENETGYPHEGLVDFVDNRVDVNTGTVLVRGVMPNVSGVINPGSFARMRIPGSAPYQALLIPDVAIGTEQNERFVLVVGADNTVQSRRVKPGALFGNLRVIVDGVKAGEAVVVNGLQQARPGAKVKPHEAPIPPGDLEALDKLMPGPGTAPATTQSAATQSAAAPATEPQS